MDATAAAAGLRVRTFFAALFSLLFAFKSRLWDFMIICRATYLMAAVKRIRAGDWQRRHRALSRLDQLLRRVHMSLYEGAHVFVRSTKFDAQAVWLFREVLQARRETFGDRHWSTLMSIGNLGLLLRDQGKYDEAEPLLREALRAKRETLGDRHLSTLKAINELGVLLWIQCRNDEVEPLWREMVSSYSVLLGGRHWCTLVSMGNLGKVLKRRCKYDEAERLLCEAVVGLRQLQGDSHRDTTTCFDFLKSLRGIENLVHELGSQLLDGVNRHPLCDSGTDSDEDSDE